MICRAELAQVNLAVRRQTIGKVLNMLLDIFKVLKAELPAFALALPPLLSQTPFPTSSEQAESRSLPTTPEELYSKEAMLHITEPST